MVMETQTQHAPVFDGNAFLKRSSQAGVVDFHL
jgi:hypothetical protein